MIKSFRHRGLEKFYQTGSKAGIQPAHARRLREILLALDAATVVESMGYPGWGLHELKGDLAAHWSVKVNGNSRVTFRFSGGYAEVIDYQDYH
jgi:proteic killer suppression protein